MKKNFAKYMAYMLLALPLVGMGGGLLTSCSNQEPFITAGPDDTPRFLAPSSIEGNVQTSVSQNREETFAMDIVVTPAKYTTIQWISDGHVLGTGASFSRQFEAGNYDLTIKATTQAGKEAYRIVKLSVSALADDPTFNNKEKNRWLNPGQPLTIVGTNLTQVKSLIFTPVIKEEEEAEEVEEASRADEQPVGDGSIEVSCVGSEDGGSVTVTLPEDMPEGSYRVSAVYESGERFGLGLVTVSNEEYVEGDVVEVALWEGNQAIDWNADLCKITAEQMADVPVGTEIKVYYTTPEAEYHSMRITTPWWGDTPEDNLVAQFDITDETPNPFIFVYDDHCKALVEERGAISLVGFGYTVQKVAYDKKVGETVIWEESPVTIDWNADLCKVSAEQMAAVPVGATIFVYYDMPEAEYHAMRITTPWWGDTPEDNLVAQFDLTDETPNPFEFTYDQHCKNLVDERGAMSLVGFGYRVSKIAFK
jgi:hypothetical protein